MKTQAKAAKALAARTMTASGLTLRRAPVIETHRRLGNARVEAISSGSGLPEKLPTFAEGVGKYSADELNEAAMTVLGELTPRKHPAWKKEAHYIASEIFNRQRRIQRAQTSFEMAQKGLDDARIVEADAARAKEEKDRVVRSSKTQVESQVAKQAYDNARRDYNTAQKTRGLAETALNNANGDRIKYGHFVKGGKVGKKVESATLAEIVELKSEFEGHQTGIGYRAAYDQSDPEYKKKEMLERWIISKAAVEELAKGKSEPSQHLYNIAASDFDLLGRPSSKSQERVGKNIFSPEQILSSEDMINIKKAKRRKEEKRTIQKQVGKQRKNKKSINVKVRPTLGRIDGSAEVEAEQAPDRIMLSREGGAHCAAGGLCASHGHEIGQGNAGPIRRQSDGTSGGLPILAKPDVGDTVASKLQDSPVLPPIQVPKDFDIRRNLAIALSLRVLPSVGKYAAFYLLVRNGGPWDYKQAFKTEGSFLGRAFADRRRLEDVPAEYRHVVGPGDEIQNPYEDFGNWHFGFMGSAAGIPEEILLRAAGAAQKIAGTSNERWSNPGLGGKAPFGDDPNDQRLIKEGIGDFSKLRWTDSPRRRFVSPSLEVGRIDDHAEREAEQVADRIMLMRDGGACCSACAAGGPCASHRHEIEQGQAAPIRRYAAGNGGGLAVPADLEPQVRRATSGGEVLPATVRASFEPRFGQDLSHVRIHRDADAAASASALGARAYTLGSHIAFAQGRWAPGTEAGDRLIAHELAHTLQASEVVQRSCSSVPTYPVGAQEINSDNTLGSMAEICLRNSYQTSHHGNCIGFGNEWRFVTCSHPTDRSDHAGFVRHSVAKSGMYLAQHDIIDFTNASIYEITTHKNKRARRVRLDVNVNLATSIGQQESGRFWSAGRWVPSPVYQMGPGLYMEVSNEGGLLLYRLLRSPKRIRETAPSAIEVPFEVKTALRNFGELVDYAGGVVAKVAASIIAASPPLKEWIGMFVVAVGIGVAIALLAEALVAVGIAVAAMAAAQALVMAVAGANTPGTAQPMA
ncbi:DUF4157 domain-containing protein [Mesorhizobium sp. LSJC269B00]|uniref:eCIS core domain-containing protein n=1 Tax=Mesorhizobium sp. LSJC269B00 TaxID=1287326 RepID=UPI00041418DF|nr:DUF4157 domain-containing protein [Mesorhizobium sp. LSJC269B00]